MKLFLWLRLQAHAPEPCCVTDDDRADAISICNCRPHVHTVLSSLRPTLRSMFQSSAMSVRMIWSASRRMTFFQVLSLIKSLTLILSLP